MKQFIFALTLCYSLLSTIYAAEQKRYGDDSRPNLLPAAAAAADSPESINPDEASRSSSRQDPPIQSFRLMAEQLEQGGQLLTAAQKMDRHLKAIQPPSISDLCYALKLNRKLSFEDRRQRSIRLAEQISKVLKVTPDMMTIDLQESSWIHLQPYLDYLIEQTTADPIYEKRDFSFIVLGEDFLNFNEWRMTMIKECRYPVGISSRNAGQVGDRKTGNYHDNRMEVSISNYTKRERDTREVDAYRFYEGELDPEKITPASFYNLMVRARLSPEELSKGKYNSAEQLPVYVKPYKFQKLTLPECVQEMKDTVLATLEKSTKPFVVLVLSLDDAAPFNVQDIWCYGNTKSFYSELPTRGTIVDSQERRLYLCYENFERNMLDLHGLSEAEASQKVLEFIQEKHDNFETSCKIVTGKGNHTTPQGTSGQLKGGFKGWVKTPALKRLVQSYRLADGGGVYHVTLYKPRTLTFKDETPQEAVLKLSTAIFEENALGHNRLQIQLNEGTEPPLNYISRLIVMASSQLFRHPDFMGMSFNISPNLTWFREFGGDRRERPLQYAIISSGSSQPPLPSAAVPVQKESPPKKPPSDRAPNPSKQRKPKKPDSSGDSSKK